MTLVQVNNIHNLSTKIFRHKDYKSKGTFKLISSLGQNEITTFQITAGYTGLYSYSHFKLKILNKTKYQINKYVLYLAPYKTLQNEHTDKNECTNSIGGKVLRVTVNVI